MNILRDASWQGQTDVFLGNFNTRAAGNDYTATTLYTVRNLFAAPTFPGQILRPVFAAINCVTNSPNRRFREVLINEFYFGGGEQDFSANIVNWRTVLDSVQAPLPEITDFRATTGGVFRFVVPAQRGRTNRVESTINFNTWTPITNITGTNAPVVFRETNIFQNPRRYYRIQRF